MLLKSGAFRKWPDTSSDSTAPCTTLMAVAAVVLEPSFSQSFAAADLSNASLRASVRNNANQGFVAGSARADLHDNVRVQVGGATADSVTRLHFRYVVDGTVVNDGQTTVFGEQGSGNLQTVLRMDQTDSGNGGVLPQ